MFYAGSTWGSDMPFNEEIFRIISDMGFNFVRVPIDYRILIRFNNWNNINENAMQRVDKAVEYGIKYNIHICLNLHRAPGYTVATPPERTNLWTEEAPQRAFAALWGYFAQRYQNVPNEYLSFNFINEPPDIDEAVYAAVIKRAADAIRAHDPKRLLIADGTGYGTRPSTMIKNMGIAQATRGYQPFFLTHYMADWVEGSEKYSVPSWPIIVIPQYLYGTGKNDVPRSVYRIEYNFNEAYNLDINVGTVSNEARLVVRADNAEIYNRLFQSGAGEGEWTTAVYRREWNIYQNIFNRDYRIQIPAGTRVLTVEITDGDWMTVNDLKFAPASSAGVTFSVTPNVPDWGSVIPPVRVDRSGRINVDSAYTLNRTWLRDTYLRSWIEMKNSGGGVMVGEWGSHNSTPHDVVLRWMEDSLEIYKEAGIGWALWNFDGSFGIVNSTRADVEYENYREYALDRKMLNLLLRYLN
jgi:aryl-phospho-beta-D-glucosidase BglC (GH1 family)